MILIPNVTTVSRDDENVAVDDPQVGKSKSQTCRPFAMPRDKQDKQTSLTRDLRQQTVHPRLSESTLGRKDYDLGY